MFQSFPQIVKVVYDTEWRKKLLCKAAVRVRVMEYQHLAGTEVNVPRILSLSRIPFASLTLPEGLLWVRH